MKVNDMTDRLEIQDVFYKILKQTLKNEGANLVFKRFNYYKERVIKGEKVYIEAGKTSTGYVNHPKDPGGETNYGITKKVAIDNGFKGNMKLLPLNKVIEIYYLKYWLLPNYNKVFKVCPNTAHKLFDMGVNMGHEQANKFIQRILSVKDDGEIGNETLLRFQSDQDKFYFDELIIKQKKFYIYLIEKKPKFEVFKDGWFNRVNSIPFIENWDKY